MFHRCFGGITGPGMGSNEMATTLKTGSAYMIVAAGIWKRTAARRAQWMRDPLNVGPAAGTKVFGIAAVNSTAAGPATGRVKPVDQPVETVTECLIAGGRHGRCEYREYPAQSNTLSRLGSRAPELALRFDDKRVPGHFPRLRQPEQV